MKCTCIHAHTTNIYTKETNKKEFAKFIFQALIYSFSRNNFIYVVTFSKRSFFKNENLYLDNLIELISADLKCTEHFRVNNVIHFHTLYIHILNKKINKIKQKIRLKIILAVNQYLVLRDLIKLPSMTVEIKIIF